ncbi:hypothetical protein JD969_13460 [Planctomycetota bacterium]|nr:hypothetical protein JD969_13460 [Planctomycetota bacterium]
MTKVQKIFIFVAIYLSLVFAIQYAAARAIPDDVTMSRIDNAKQLIAIMDLNAHLVTPEQRKRLLQSNGVYEDWQTVGMRK